MRPSRATVKCLLALLFVAALALSPHMAQAQSINIDTGSGNG